MVVYPTLKFLRKFMVFADKIFGIKTHLQLSLCHLQCQVCDASCSNTGSCWCVKFIPDCIDIYLSVMTVKTVMRPPMLIKDANKIPSVWRNRKLLHVSKRSFFFNNLFQTKNWTQYLFTETTVRLGIRKSHRESIFSRFTTISFSRAAASQWGFNYWQFCLWWFTFLKLTDFTSFIFNQYMTWIHLFHSSVVTVQCIPLTSVDTNNCWDLSLCKPCLVL